MIQPRTVEILASLLVSVSSHDSINFAVESWAKRFAIFAVAVAFVVMGKKVTTFRNL